MELAEYSDYLEDGYEKLFEEKHNIRKILVFCDDIPKIRRIKQQIYDASGACLFFPLLKIIWK